MKKKLLFFVFASLLYLQSISPVLAASDAVTADGFQYTTSGLTATITKYTGTASTVNIPSKINDYTVTKVEYNAFVNNLSITNVIFPSSVTEIGNNAFSGCTALVKITLPSGLKKLGAGFISGTAVASLTIPASLTSCSTNSSGGPLAGADKLTDLTIESGMEKIPDSLAYCVADTSHITTVSIPNTVTSIENRAFYNCRMLPAVSLPANLQTIDSQAFSYCRSLDKITLPKTVKTVGSYAFSYCTALSSLGFTENAKTGFTLSVNSYAFSNCTSLCDITFSKNITLLDYGAFYKCSSLTSLVLPDSITEIGDSAFANCSALERITLPSGLKKLGGGFISGTAVTSLTIPASLTSCSTSSSGGPLAGADKLTDLTIESGMEKIPDYLAYCVANTSHITTVSIPNTVTSIGRSSFYNCPLLGEINIPGSVTSIADNAFDGWKNLVFKGISGTTAETYANEKGIPFKESIQEGTWVLAGRLDGVNTSNRTIDLEERVYNVSSDFDINTASNIIKNSSDRIVVFTCSDGKITHMEAAEDIVQVSISLVEYGLGSDNFTYENNQYSGALSYHVKLKTTIDPKSSYSLSEFRQLLPNYTISVARIQVKPVTPLTAHFTDIDLNYATGEFNTPVKLGLNNYKNVATVVFNVDSSFVPEKAKTELSATFYAQHHKNFTVNSNQVKFTITNKDYYRQQAEKKKEQSEREQNIKKAQNMLTNNNILSFPADLNDYFTTQQLEELRAFLSGYVATVINSSKFSYTEDQSNSASKLVLDKLFGKMGLNKKTFVMGKTLNGAFSVSANTKKGARTINFSFSISNYGLGNTEFGAMGGLNYSISQDNKSGYIPVVSANASALAQQMKSIAEDAVKNVYNESWGKHADEVAEILFTKTVTDLIGKTKMGSFSNCVYTMFTKPAASTSPSNRYTKSSIHCPVDVYVYDLNHTLCGAIVNNVVDTTYDELDMYVDGDTKFISFYQSDYYLKLVGNDTGTMTYEIEEYVDNQLTRKLSYNDIPLTDGKTYNSYVPGNQNLDASIYSPIDESDNKLEVFFDSKSPSPERTNVESLQLDQTTKVLKVGGAFTLVPSVSPANATIKDVFWTTDNETIATVDSNGTVTAHSAGFAIITAHTFDGDFTATCTLTVTTPPESSSTPGVSNTPETSKLNATFKLSMKSIVLKKGQTTTAFKVTGLAKGDKVTSYSSSNKKIATISSKGKIKGRKIGTAKIIVTLASGKKISVKIKVQKKPVATKKIMVSPSRISLSPKKKYKLNVTRIPLTTVEKTTYKSSNPKIASVSAKGVITAKKKGTVTISIRSGKKKKAVKVTVK